MISRAMGLRSLNAAGKPPAVPDAALMHAAAALEGILANGFVAVKGIGREAEQVFHRKGHAGGSVILQFCERNEHVGVGIGMVELEVLEEVPARRHVEPRVALPAPQVARVLKLDAAERCDRLYVPPCGARDRLQA